MTKSICTNAMRSAADWLASVVYLTASGGVDGLLSAATKRYKKSHFNYSLT